MSTTSLPTKINHCLIAWALVLFGFVAAAVTWLWATAVNPDTDFSPAIILIAYSPSLAALLVTWLIPAAGGLRPLLKQMFIWRVSIGWYALALLGPLIVVLVATLLYVLAGGASPSQWLALPTAGAMGGLIGPLIAGSIGEEFGWRGFAQRLLQKRHSLLWASVIVGVLWATWHLWPVFAPRGTEYASALDVLETYVRLIATAVIYGWIYVRTGGSLLLVMLAHAGHNIAVDLVPAALLDTVAMPLLIACLYAAAAMVLVAARPAHFSAVTKTQ